MQNKHARPVGALVTAVAITASGALGACSTEAEDPARPRRQLDAAAAGVDATTTTDAARPITDSGTPDTDRVPDAGMADTSTPRPGCPVFDGGLMGDAGEFPCSNFVDGGAPRTICQEYCDTLMNNCRGVSTQYASCTECVAMCKTFPTSDGGATAIEMGGNSKNCRRDHAEAAGADPLTHCGHAGPFSAGSLCGTPCEGFCSVEMAVCNAEAGVGNGFPAYADFATCTAACASFSPNDGGATPTCPKAGNTRHCRFYQARQAATVDVGSCANTTTTPTAACN